MIDLHPFPNTHLDSNPLLRREINGLALAAKLRNVRQFFWRVIRIAVLGTIVLYFGIGVTQCTRHTPNTCDLATIGVGTGELSSLFSIVAFTSLLIGLLLDFDFVSSPGARLIHERDSGHLDLMRITTLTAEQIIAAKYVGAQLRVGRTLTIEIALRAVTVVVYGFGSLMGETANFSAASFVILLLSFIIVGYVYLLEPIWRMHMVVAMGLATSIRARNVTSLTLTNIGALLAMRLMQGFLAGGYFFVLSFAAVFLAGGDEQLYLWTTVLGLGLFGLCIYLFYRTGRRWMLHRAVRLIR